MAVKIPATLDQNDPEKKELDTLIQRWIDEAKATHTDLVSEYNEIDTKMNGEYGLSGFTNKATAELERLQDPNQPKQKSLIFGSVNRGRSNHESILGEFVQSKRKLGVKGRTPRDRNRARVFQKRLEYIEDENMMASKVIFPCFDEAFAKGTCWVDVTYSQQLTKPVHKFHVEMVSARDVIVDPISRGLAFENSRYRGRRIRYELEDARTKFKEYPYFIPDLLSSDTEYDEGYSGSSMLSTPTGSGNATGFSPTTTDKFCTIYKVIFWQLGRDYFKLKTAQGADGTITPDLSGNIEQIAPEEFQSLSGNKKTERFVFAGPLEKRFYLVLFHRSHGVFHIERHEVGEFTLIPLVNIHTLWRFWPYGDFMMYANLQDLFDMLVTILIDNARKNNDPLVEVDEEAWATYSEQIEKAIREGGAAPGVKSVHGRGGEINAALVELMRSTTQWLQEVASRHSVSLGQLPSRQVAKDTVLALMNKDRSSHGRKDVMVNLFLTMLAKVLVKMIMLLDRDPDFIPLEDAAPGDPEYIPVNQVWTEGEYLANLAMIANLPTDPQSPEERTQINQMLQQLKRKFESVNEVTIEQFEGYKIGGRELKPEEVAGVVRSTGMQLKDIWQQYKPEHGIYKRYHVNEFTDDADLSVIYSIDNDLRSDPEFQLARAQMARRESIMGRLDFADALGITNGQEMIDRRDAEDRSIMLAKEIAANPQLFNKVMVLLQNAKEYLKSNGQEKKAPVAES